MTNTTLLPLAEQRRLWLIELGEPITAKTTETEYIALLARIMLEGPKLARPDNMRWRKRFRWIDNHLAAGHSIRWIVLQSLIDLNYARD